MSNMLQKNKNHGEKSKNISVRSARPGTAGRAGVNSVVNYVKVGRGAPVILAHGLAASLHDWDELLPELARNG